MAQPSTDEGNSAESTHQAPEDSPLPVSEAGLSPDFVALLESAARLQQLVPGAVMVGGSAAALHAHHRFSTDHDHVLEDLQDRYEAVLDAVEASEGWATAVGVSKPPLTILGSQAGYEAGIRQLRRTRPLETQRFTLPSGATLTVPTLDETIRVKGYMVIQRNAMRDYLDLVALADRAGNVRAGQVLANIGEWYAEKTGHPEALATLLAQRLADPNPKDSRAIATLSSYKGLAEKWRTWDAVRDACHALAKELLR
jgi:hypothetical protein